ncbi:RNA polymerase sigma-70 factor, ECF subfamily [Pedobacter sp. ok626]|uniref:RNA polymerase sigma factor n=1 Tax=Pedobacter sp. ok626 TaxID=1761882 RepID=UPI00088EC28D|nr:RNA polymerase sigma-70 factor [Pedobacter sp. ok626]SDL64948.1 RNA polymerase sigma-70 factor, ECF subfamily [Pedobacter sp. ok626]
MIKYNNLSDYELTALIKQEDRSAYEEIYERYWVLLYRHARKMLQNEDESKDVVQDVFVMLWNIRLKLDVKLSVSSLLYTAVKNQILNKIKHEKVASNHLQSLSNFELRESTSTDYKIREQELALIIEAEIALLPDRMREVFELKRKSDLSYKEIAAEMNISELTVKTQMNKAIKALKKKLDANTFISAFPFL